MGYLMSTNNSLVINNCVSRESQIRLIVAPLEYQRGFKNAAKLLFTVADHSFFLSNPQTLQ